MQRLALLAILPWLALGCSPPATSSPNGASSSGDVDSSVADGGRIGDGDSGGDGTASSGPPITCDSGGPLALKTMWPLPAVDTTEGIAFTVDSQGQVYVAGTFNGSLTFGSTTLTAPTAAGTSNMFLAKYDGDGHVLFAKSWGTTTGHYLPPAIAVDSAGNVFLGGAFENTLDFGGSSAPLDAVSYLDGFAAKISPTGDAVWAVRFGYSDGAAVLSIAMTPDGDPIVAGSARGAIVLGSTLWPAAGQSTEQPFIAKLSTTDGTVLWGNATGGDIVSGDGIFVSSDSAGRVFVAARVESGGGAWGGSSDGGNFGALRAGFDSDGSILWGQVDDGAFPAAAAVDHAGRFWVLEDAENTVTVSGTNTTFGSAQSGTTSLSMLFSPVDGTLLSGLDIGDTFPNAGAVDGHGNSLVTGTYWPSRSSPRPVGNLSLPAGSEAVQPFFLASLDGLSRAVSAMTLPTTDIAQPYALTMDPGSGHVFVLASLGSASTTDGGTTQPGLVVAVFGPDPCDDGAGPSGPSTGTAGNHGVLLPDGGSPYVAPDAVAPAACPASTAGAVNGAACPVAMGCSYGTTCCICTPTSCHGEPTLWTCDAIQNDAGCPSSPPTPGTACPSTALKCNYCEPGGRLYANCNAGGWSTGYARILCL
jgi:hypothetical protein